MMKDLKIWICAQNVKLTRKHTLMHTDMHTRTHAHTHARTHIQCLLTRPFQPTSANVQTRDPQHNAYPDRPNHDNPHPQCIHFRRRCLHLANVATGALHCIHAPGAMQCQQKGQCFFLSMLDIDWRAHTWQTRSETPTCCYTYHLQLCTSTWFARRLSSFHTVYS